ncbi:MAG: hypothetical protein J2O47_09740 [Acidimicrobiaceae bacterium]|nr:hypothetical protein [Acidimicrobiaceae bacterium]
MSAPILPLLDTEPDAMRIHSLHERLVAAAPERVAALVADFDRIWPTEIMPAPRAREERRFDAGAMVWEEVDRPGAVRAFRVIEPPGLRQLAHWFEVERVDGGTLLRHTVDGEALEKYATVWRERVEPTHDRVLEALLDNVEALTAA